MNHTTRIQLLQSAIQGYERRIKLCQDQITEWELKVIELERIEREEERVRGVVPDA